MTNRDVTTFCTAADKSLANSLAANNGGGPNTYSVALSTTQGVTNPSLATHWAGSGQMESALVDALETSVAPLIQVRSNTGKTFDQHCAESVPKLYRIYESL